MNKQDYAIGSRTYHSYAPLSQELIFFPNKNYLFTLSHLAIIKVSGNQAMEFLQGQLSCDVRLVNDITMQQGALCNLKGRVLALVDVLKDKNDYYLILSKDLVDQTITSLSKTAILSRISLEPILDLNCHGLLATTPLLKNLPGQRYQVQIAEQNYYYTYSENCWMIITKNEPQQLATTLGIFEPLKGSLAWHYLRLIDQHIEIYPETRGSFLPHRLNLPKQGYVSFNKGCYKGQEIIARIHYRTIPKHSLTTVQVYSSTRPILGAPLYNAENHDIGEVIDYCITAEEHKYLLMISIFNEHEGSFKLNQQEELKD